MLPTRQRLDTVDDPAALHERRFRLVVRDEFVVRDAAGEIFGVELRALMDHGRELRCQLADGNGFFERAAHGEPMAYAELVSGREHALVAATDQHDVGRAGARRQRPQQLDTVGVGQVQLHHDQ